MGSEYVLLHLESGTYFGLDRIGARFWEMLQQRASTIAVIRDQLLGEYDVTEARLEEDLLALASELLEHNLIARS